MRHLWSFLAGLVVVPVTWVLVALGQDGSASTVDRWVEIGTSNTANLIEPAVYLAVGGVVLGLLGTLRISPLGPLVAGLLLVTPYVGLFVTPFRVRERIPGGWKFLGDPLPLRLPVENGTLFLIGMLLLIATFSGQRWRRWPAPVAGPVPVAADGPGVDSTAGDWPPATSPAEPDTTPLSLGYPDPTPTEPLPRRTGGGSPWSAPPGNLPRRDDATN
ncbi:hypothetical protein SAMN05443287_105324 [Micromonospora phaseoli]|uniref:Uncharacterized protein n=1 Tax=Micromonospora phaseoli TaxID=1144548 RepID=A0A1H6ZVU9_9ACTN|nr:hypothetical protein [Micromonospora phaseoli]PZV96982.1 hypothetical protein CLV64_10689 [Micromonospora phaseoli]GIJ77958.1 hypothetical protein Xph01_23900 [Micromonospora phaseoli]SEJ57599.1 hypothetical protein SAMN05443287_105324 [Micromonospora phaseoli]